MTGTVGLSISTRERRTVYGFVALIAVVYAVLALLRLVRFDLTAFDAGIFDNVLWRLGHGYSDVTALTGAHHLSDHMSPLLLLAIPLYATVPQWGLPALIVAQAVSVALVGLAAWLLAVQVGLDERTRRIVLLVTTIGAGAYNAALIDVHEVGLALGPLALTVALAMRGSSLRSYWIWPTLAALARIDLAVSVVIIGLLLRGDRSDHGRVALWIGGVAATLMGVWLVVNPWEGTSFAFHFAHLGIDSITQLPAAVVRDPIAALQPLLDPTMYGTILIWLAGFTMVMPLRAARWLLPAVPTVFIPVLGSWQQADLPHLHYWHVLLPMLAIAMVFGFARSPVLGDRVLYLGVAAIAVTWVFMPLFKPSFGDDLTAERAVVEYINNRPQAAVAVPGNLVPHVDRRPTVLQLPTPFACPTLPIASFTGPQSPPDLVALPPAVLQNPATPAARVVAETLETYYEPLRDFGGLVIWGRNREIPRPVYDIVCGPVASENSP